MAEAKVDHIIVVKCSKEEIEAVRRFLGGEPGDPFYSLDSWDEAVNAEQNLHGSLPDDILGIASAVAHRAESTFSPESVLFCRS